jgi:hypothetical protein
VRFCQPGPHLMLTHPCVGAYSIRPFSLFTGHFCAHAWLAHGSCPVGHAARRTVRPWEGPLEPAGHAWRTGL